MTEDELDLTRFELPADHPLNQGRWGDGSQDGNKFSLEYRDEPGDLLIYVELLNSHASSDDAYCHAALYEVTGSGTQDFDQLEYKDVSTNEELKSALAKLAQSADAYV